MLAAGDEPVADGTVVFRKSTSGGGLVEVGVWTTTSSSSLSSFPFSRVQGSEVEPLPGSGQRRPCRMLWFDRLSHSSREAKAAAPTIALRSASATGTAAEDAVRWGTTQNYRDRVARNDDAEKHLRLGMQRAAELLIHLPNSRKHEHEADLIGLKLAAMAGYPLDAGIEAVRALSMYGSGVENLRGKPGVVGAVADRMVCLRKCLHMLLRGGGGREA